MNEKKQNTLIHISDAASFFIGVSLCSFNVIIPSYVKNYTSSAVLLALIPVIVDLGMCLPQLFSVYFFKYRKHRGDHSVYIVNLYFMLELIHRISFIAIGISIMIFHYDATAALVSFYVLFIVSNFSWGIVIPNWVDVLSVTIPDRGRTSFLAKREFVGRCFGIAASLTLPVILSIGNFPENYGFLFLIAGFFFTSGIIPAKFFKPVSKSENPQITFKSFRKFLKTEIMPVFQNKKIIKFFLLFWFLGVSRITYAYFTPYTIDSIISKYPKTSSTWMVSALNFCSLVFMAVVPLIMSKVIKKIGYRESLYLCSIFLFFSNVLIVAFPFYWAAILGMFFLSAFIMTIFLSNLNGLMDYTHPRNRASVSALSSTGNAFFIMGFSLIGSLIACYTGYKGALIFTGLVSLIILLFSMGKK